ncbi:MAG: glycosyltransferase family 9 protein, partial [Candidatus Omnitrophica bacterium]|nr:glycosyltransferase family 9 protein [Candidatus Omnitrophota bacterium]
KKKIEGFEDKHVVEYYLDLLGLMNVPATVREARITVDPGTLMWAREYLKKKGMTARPFIGIIPGGGSSWGPRAGRKRYSPAGFAKAADELASLYGPVALLGDVSEESLCREVASAMRDQPLFIETGLDLERYMGLLSVLDIVILNDGGPLHIARALGLRTVSIFGPVDPNVYGPYPPSEGNKVITARGLECRPCYLRFKLPECGYDGACLEKIDPSEIVKAVSELVT